MPIKEFFQIVAKFSIPKMETLGSLMKNRNSSKLTEGKIVRGSILGTSFLH